VKPIDRQVPAQDPDLKNSPIAWEAEEDSEALQAEAADAPVCFFNDVEYAHGSSFATHGIALRCDHGVWIATEAQDQ